MEPEWKKKQREKERAEAEEKRKAEGEPEDGEDGESAAGEKKATIGRRREAMAAASAEAFKEIDQTQDAALASIQRSMGIATSAEEVISAT